MFVHQLKFQDFFFNMLNKYLTSLTKLVYSFDIMPSEISTSTINFKSHVSHNTQIVFWTRQKR